MYPVSTREPSGKLRISDLIALISLFTLEIRLSWIKTSITGGIWEGGAVTPTARSPVSGRDIVPGRWPSLNEPLPVAIVMVEPATRIASVDAIKILRRAEIIDIPSGENSQIMRRPGITLSDPGYTA